MQALYAAVALQDSAGWSAAGIFLVALVICCLVMMFTMRMRMRGRSGNRDEMDTHSNHRDQETPTKKL